MQYRSVSKAAAVEVVSHDPHNLLEVLPVHLRLALPEEWCSMINALKLGESAAAAHVLDDIEVADDRYDQLFAGHRPQSHKSIDAVQQSTWQSAGARMD